MSSPKPREHRLPSFSPLLEETLQQISQAEDELDGKAFDPSDYFNRAFPTQSSLSKLDSWTQQMREQERRLEVQVLEAVAKQSGASTMCTDGLSQARVSALDLGGRLNGIASKAQQSFEVVQTLTSDVRHLDVAKKNLEASISASRKLAMLKTASDALVDLVGTREYGEAAKLMAATSQLLDYILQYGDVEICRSVGEKTKSCKLELLGQIQEDFEGLSPTLSDGAKGLLQEGAKYIEACGEAEKLQLVDWFVNRELKPYATLFEEGQKTGSIEFIEQRFVWLRKKLHEYSQFYNAVFPLHWGVGHALVKEFLNKTRAGLMASIKAESSTLSGSLFSHAYKKCYDFECKLQSTIVAGGDMDYDGFQQSGEEESEASKIRRKYQQPRSAAANGIQEGESEAETGTSKPSFVGMLSSLFEEHSEIYAEGERRELEEAVKTSVRQESWDPCDHGDGVPIFESSLEVMLAIKKSLQQCLALPKSRSLLPSLCTAFSTALEGYANSLQAIIPTKYNGSKLLPDAIQVKLAAIVSTAEHCIQAIQGLKDAIDDQLDEDGSSENADCPNSASDCTAAIDSAKIKFVSLSDTSLSTLHLALSSRLYSFVQGFSSVPWATIESVGDESEYVNSLSKQGPKYLSQYRAILNTKHFLILLEKLISSFCRTFLDWVLNLRSISHEGAQQLLLDVQSLRSILTSLAGSLANKEGMGDPPSRGMQAIFKLVQIETGVLDGVAKALLSGPGGVLPTAKRLVPTLTEAQLHRLSDVSAGKGKGGPSQPAPGGTAFSLQDFSQQQQLAERLQAGMKLDSFKEGLGGMTRAFREGLGSRN